MILYSINPHRSTRHHLTKTFSAHSQLSFAFSLLFSLPLTHTPPQNIISPTILSTPFIMSNATTTQNKPESEQPQQQKPQVLEEDDEFEDFPVEGRSHLTHRRYQHHQHHQQSASLVIGHILANFRIYTMNPRS